MKMRWLFWYRKMRYLLDNLLVAICLSKFEVFRNTATHDCHTVNWLAAEANWGQRRLCLVRIILTGSWLFSLKSAGFNPIDG